jgi:outer membrane protein assembly factor BamB
MKSIRAFSFLVLASATPLCSQVATIDWPSAGNDSQRTSWEKSDSRITQDNVKDFQLVMKMSLDPKIKGVRGLTPPVVLGRLISYRGFKELAFVQSASDRLWALDADMNRIFWEKSFEKPRQTAKNSGPNAATCAESVVAAPALNPPVAFGGRGRGGPGSPVTPPPAAPATTEKPSVIKTLLGAGGFGGARPVFALSSDGKLHLLNTSTGDDVVPAMTFLPNGARASSLTVAGGVIYTTTSWGCGGAPNGVWSINLNNEEPKVSNFPVTSGDLPAFGGISFGADGTVYAQTSSSIAALSAPDLKPVTQFTVPGGFASTTPVLFTYQDHELMIAAGKDGRLFVIDPKQPTPVSETLPLGKAWGALSSWQDTQGTRWVLAPVWGPVNSEIKSEARNGAIVAFRLDDSNGTPKLTPVWVSRDLLSPEPPVITSGIVFALSAGDYSNNEHAKPSGHATLYAFDGASGKELYTSANQAAAPANLNGVTLANGRVFFATTDGTLYGFGIFLER